MREYISTHVHIALHLLVIAIAIVMGAWFANYSNKSIESTIREHMRAQRIELVQLAEIIDRNGADVDVEKIIADCTRRNEYESLLVKLGTLPKKDLITLQNLHDGCGTFYAERKALMVSRFERELESFIDQNDLLKSLNTQALSEKELVQWNELLTLEKKRSQLLTEQSTIQAKIITALISGSSVASAIVGALVNDAQQIAERLTVHDHEIDNFRNSLIE